MEQQIRMVVVDLDDTLLDDKKQIGIEITCIRQKLKEINILFTIATARSIANAHPYILDLEPDYVISCDGGLITKGEKILVQNIIPREQFEKLYQRIIISKEIGKISIVSTTGDYCNYDGKTLPSVFDGDILKVICKIFKKQICNQLQMENSNLLFSHYAGQNWVRISNVQATKYNAIKQLCEMLALFKDEVMAFGDDYNDVEMIMNCGIGVAMSNAVEEVKSIADFITMDNNSEGVADFLKKYFDFD